jgi:hypothetical protein
MSRSSRSSSPPPYGYGDSHGYLSSPPPYQTSRRVFDSNGWLNRWSILASGRDIRDGLVVNGRHTSESNVYLAALCQIFDASVEWWAALDREVERRTADGGRDWVMVTELKRSYLMYGRRPLRQAWNLRGGRVGEGEMVKRVVNCLRGALEDLGEEGRERVDFLRGGRTGRAGWHAEDRLTRRDAEDDELPGYGEVGRSSGGRRIVSGGSEMYTSGQYDGEGQGWVRRVWQTWMRIDDNIPVHLRGSRHGRYLRDM